MRVWALASCGGLLALAACSAEQSKVPAPGELTQDSDTRPQVAAEPDGALTPLGPTTAPELYPRPGLPSGVRQPTSSPLTSASVDRGATQSTELQSTELQTRLQRLRAQHSARLNLSAGQVAAPSLRSSPLVRAPLVTSPLPAQLPASRVSAAPAPEAQPTRVPETAGAPETGVAQTRIPGTGGTQAIAAPAQLAVAPGLGDSPTPVGTAADLAPLASASPDQRYPIAPRRHQGHSTRPSPTDLVLMPQAEPALATAAVPRLHGESPDGPATVALIPAVPDPAAQAALPSAAAAAPVAPSPLPSPGQHQGTGAQSSSLEVRSPALGRSQALAGAQRPTAIPQPESLPLHSPPSGLRQVRPQPLEPRVEDAGRGAPAAIAEPLANPDGDRRPTPAEALPLTSGEQGDWPNLPATAKGRFAPCPSPGRATAHSRGEVDLGRWESAMESGLGKGPELCSADRSGDGPGALPGESFPEAALEALPTAPVTGDSGE